MIDGALAYDPQFRPSFVYLNEDDAHNRAGKANGEVLAQILRTYKEGGHVIAEVLPQRKYRDGKFEELAAPDGSHPGRSVDLWHQKLIPGCSAPYYLEGVALCGAQKPATVNLPAIYYSTQFGLNTVTFSINTGLTGEGHMENKEEKVDLAAFQKQLDDLKTEFAAEKEKNTTLAAERDHYRTEAEAFGNKLKEVTEKLDRQEVERFFSDNLKLKVKEDEKAGLIALALSLKNEKVELSAGKSRYAEFLDSLKNRPDVIKLAIVGGNLPNQISNGSQPQTPNEAINQFAAENNIDPDASEADFNKAEFGARKKYPSAFGIKEGVQ